VLEHRRTRRLVELLPVALLRLALS